MNKQYKPTIDRYTYRAKAYGYKRSRSYYTNSRYKWYYGDLKHSNDGTVILFFWDDLSNEYIPKRIEPDTICQCSGLLDSDGKPIFEHDIISVPQMNKDNEYVIFNNGSFMLGDGFMFYHLNESIQSNQKHDIKYYVIGNTYDDPDLLRLIL